MLVEGVLVHALALCNGVSVVQMNDWSQENVEYFHIELENHELIFAEGSLSETFVDNVTRKAFDNWREYAELYGEEASVIPELPLPRVEHRRQLSQRTKQRLLALAQIQHVA